MFASVSLKGSGNPMVGSSFLGGLASFPEGSGNPMHCKKFHGFHPLRKGFAADILSREGTDTLVLIPFIKGMKTF